MTRADVEGHAPAWDLFKANIHEQIQSTILHQRRRAHAIHRRREREQRHGQDTRQSRTHPDHSDERRGNTPLRATEHQRLIRAPEGEDETLYRYDLNYKKQKDAYLREWYRRRSKDPAIRERINASNKRAYYRNIEARRAYARQYYYEKKKARTNSDATATAQA